MLSDKPAKDWKAAAKLFWQLWIEACNTAAYYESELDAIQPHYAKRLRHQNLLLKLQTEEGLYREVMRDELAE